MAAEIRSCGGEDGVLWRSMRWQQRSIQAGGRSPEGGVVGCGGRLAPMHCRRGGAGWQQVNGGERLIPQVEVAAQPHDGRCESSSSVSAGAGGVRRSLRSNQRGFQSESSNDRLQSGFNQVSNGVVNIQGHARTCAARRRRCRPPPASAPSPPPPPRARRRPALRCSPRLRRTAAHPTHGSPGPPSAFHPSTYTECAVATSSPQRGASGVC